MNLPFGPPLQPMLAMLADEIPIGDYLYEPKWDGFRALIFRDGAYVRIQSRDDRPLLRYFPELAEPLSAALPERCVVDGEIVIMRGGALDFELLQMRLHPAASRVNVLAAEIPARVVLWDLLSVGDEDLVPAPLRERRARLQALVRPNASVVLTPATTDRRVAEDWFARFRGAGTDGVIAKRLEGPYEPGKRGWVKVKHERTIDAAVAGFRWQKGARGTEVGSLVLALFDEHGTLRPIGVASGFSRAKRVELIGVLEPWRDAGADHPWARWGEGEHRPDNHSRWSRDKDLSWEPLRLGLVAEVHTTQVDSRLRHPAKLVRFRADRTAESCTTEQIRVVPAGEIAELWSERLP